MTNTVDYFGSPCKGLGLGRRWPVFFESLSNFQFGRNVNVLLLLLILALPTGPVATATVAAAQVVTGSGQLMKAGNMTTVAGHGAAAGVAR
jgi:hypothetical protein